MKNYKFIFLFIILLIGLFSFSSKSVYAGEKVGKEYEDNIIEKAKRAKSTYEFTVCTIKGDCNIDQAAWGQSMIINNAANLVVGTLCTSNRADDVMIDGDSCTPDINDSDMQRLYSERGFLGGGLASIVATGYQSVGQDYTNPTDLALFFKDYTGDTIFGTPAYAGGDINGTVMKTIVLQIWIVSRNLALSLLGIITAASALMIIFRKKVSAQSVITVYNVLPRIPIAIVVILLSYPIGALLVSMVKPLIYLAISLSFDIFNGMLGTVDVSGLLYYAISSVTTVILGFIAVIAAGNIAVILIILAIAITFIVMLVVLLVNIIKTYAGMIFDIIMLPLVSVLSILPGKEKGVVNLLLKMLVDVLTIPIMIMIMLVGLAIMLVPVSNFDFDVPMFALFALAWVFILKMILGLIVIWQAKKVNKVLTDALGVTGIFSSGPKR